jgi:hypothetical protein
VILAGRACAPKDLVPRVLPSGSFQWGPRQVARPQDLLHGEGQVGQEPGDAEQVQT